MTVAVRHTNPGLDLSSVREAAREVNAAEVEQSFTPPAGEVLRITDHTAEGLGAETENGHLQVVLRTSDGEELDTRDADSRRFSAPVATFMEVAARTLLYLSERYGAA